MIEITLKLDDRLIPLIEALTAVLEEQNALIKGGRLDDFKQDLAEAGRQVAREQAWQARDDAKKDIAADRREEKAAAAAPEVVPAKKEVVTALQRVMKRYRPEKGTAADAVKEILATKGGGASSTGALNERYYAAVIAAADELAPPEIKPVELDSV